MFFIVHSQIKNVIIAYLCLYLPPILLVNIFITYRPYFYTRTYYNIRQSIQAVGNGIVFCLVIKMLEK
jgi:chromate transport protein ChrA